MNPTLYIGCDAHKSASVFCAIDEDGNTVWQGERPTTPKGFGDVRQRFKDYDVRIVVEACGLVWKIVDMLSELDFEVYVCNPNKNPQIGRSRKKTDIEDARKLANLFRGGYLSYVYIPTEEQRRIRSVARERQGLVQVRTKWKNQIHSARYEDQKSRKKYLIEQLDNEVADIDAIVKKTVDSWDEAKLLMTTPGIAEYASFLIMGEICTIDRFPTCAQYRAYCGLVPSIRQSSDVVHMGSVRKDSDPRLRWIYTQVAWHAVRLDPWLGRFFARKAKEKGKAKAIIAVAKKLASYNYWMLKKRMTYQELVSAVHYVG